MVSAPDAPPAMGSGLLPTIVPAEADTAPGGQGVVSASVSAPAPPLAREFTPAAPTALVETLPAPTAVVVMPSISPDTDRMMTPATETQTLPRRGPTTFQRRPRPRVRRVTRVVRHVDTWSVFKVALVFNAFFYLVSLTAGVLLWQVAYATGTIDNIEKFFEGFGWSSFQFKGGEIFHNAWIAGLFVSIGFTGLAVFMATLFNLITDLVGGIRVSVLEEEVIPRNERSLLLRFGRPGASTNAAADAE